jgi:hypothetical protein
VLFFFQAKDVKKEAKLEAGKKKANKAVGRSEIRCLYEGKKEGK